MAPTLFDTPAKPGDMIEIFRGMYQHWALYIGGNEVVHLIPERCHSGDLSVLLTIVDSSVAEVSRHKLWEVVGDDSYHVNNCLDEEYKPRERHVIVREACMMVGKLLPYSINTYNCEHFVTELRYGKPESRQVKEAVAIGAAVVAGVRIVAMGAALIAALTKDDDESRNRNRNRNRHGSTRRYNWQ